MSVVYRWYVSGISDRSSVGGISMVYQWYIGQISVVYRSNVGGISMVCQWYIGQVSVVYLTKTQHIVKQLIDIRRTNK